MGLRYLGNIIRPGYDPLASNITTGVNTAQHQGVFTLQQQAQAQSTQSWVTEPLFDFNTLLLQADGTVNGSQNSTFLDSSSNNFAITRNGNTTQGSFTPFSQAPGYWGAYLTGVYGSSTFTSRTLFNGNSTIEGWVYPNALSGQQTIIVGGGINFGTNGAKLRIDDGVNAGSIFESTGTITANTWNHVAVVRTSNTFAFYINGNLDSSNASISSFYTSNATSLNVGAFNSSGTNVFTGYLSNIRISNVARAISVPTIPYSSDANTVWLIFQSNRFVDNSSNAYALTFAGTPSVQAFSPFAPQFQWTPSVIGGSGYFDGTGDFLSVPASSQFLPGVNTDFTFEAWVYLTAAPSAQGATVVGTGEYGLNSDWSISINSSRVPSFYFNVLPSGFNLTSSTAINLNSWNHIAVTRSGTGANNLKMFLNGVNVAQASRNDTLDYNGNNLSIGADENGDESNVTGYISGLRLINGTGYTSISVPTAPPTAITNTVLLCNFTNAGIFDAAMKNVFETTGNAQVSTSIVKYGSGSMYFDGTGDALYIPVPQKENLRFGTGDFTIEFWAWKPADGSTSYDVVISVGSTGNYFGGFDVELSATRGFCFIYDGAVRISSNFNPNDSTWHHYAVVRNGSTFALYKDGSQLTTATLTPTLGITGEAWIGAGVNSTSNNFNGYIDDLRVTKGVARYITSFTPPTVALPRQ